MYLKFLNMQNVFCTFVLCIIFRPVLSLYFLVTSCKFFKLLYHRIDIF